MNAGQILTGAEMRAAEERLIAGGVSVDALMLRAGQGAAEWVWRAAAGRAVSVLCGPGNNGGDGYVIAEALRARGATVRVIAPRAPGTAAARTARAAYQGEVLGADANPHGEVLVDCLYGTGLTRPLSDDDAGLLAALAAGHHYRIAVDLPSGVDADSGAALNPGLPEYQLTLGLGAWKFAHFLMPACAAMGALRLVPIGVGAVDGAAQALARPHLPAPAADAHKYRRGLLGVVAGTMPGAALLAARAAQGAGAGYVKLLGSAAEAPADLVCDPRALAQAVADPRFGALLVGPGLGRDSAARDALALVLASAVPCVIDADALHLLSPAMARPAPLVLTPHEGELVALEAAFGTSGSSKPARAAALARASGAVVVAKGPDTVIAAPDGRIVCAPRASSWLSTAGTGDVLAGAIASRLAGGAGPFAAACEGVWLHAGAARALTGPFSASQLAAALPSAYAAGA